MRKWLLWSLFVVGGAAVLLRFTLLAPEPIHVKVVRVERGRVESTITNTKAGTVRARRRAKLSSEVGGRVVEIAHREGDRVKTGVALIGLNDATQRAQLRLAEEGLRVAEASPHVKPASRAIARGGSWSGSASSPSRRSSPPTCWISSRAPTRSRGASCNAVTAEVDRAQAADRGHRGRAREVGDPRAFRRRHRRGRGRGRRVDHAVSSAAHGARRGRRHRSQLRST